MKVDNLTVKKYTTREEMGAAAARDIRNAIRTLLEKKAEINVIFAAAPSQNEVLRALVGGGGDWSRVNAYHMDEYIHLPPDAPQCFGNFLTGKIFGKVPFKSVNLIDSTAPDAQAECDRYEAILRANPADIIILGIGENGHIAFNDPWVANFKDDRLVRIVALDDVCRQQQVNDGCFATLEEVPKIAMTLTCPVFIRAPQLFCIVPALAKANAVKRTLEGAISEECPATVLRSHGNAVLYLDADSASKLSE